MSRKFNEEILKQLVEEKWNELTFDVPVIYEPTNRLAVRTGYIYQLIERKKPFEYNQLAENLVNTLRTRMLTSTISKVRSISIFKLPEAGVADFISGKLVCRNLYITASFRPVGKYWWGDVEAGIKIHYIINHRLAYNHAALTSAVGV
jgi:hypothetical protein